MASKLHSLVLVSVVHCTKLLAADQFGTVVWGPNYWRTIKTSADGLAIFHTELKVNLPVYFLSIATHLKYLCGIVI